jgi:serine/threonine protein kinase/tetratricopeptide (TPR) repeat protein
LKTDRGSLGEEAFGRYRLLDALGQGGMAEVFKAKSFGVEGFEKVLVIKRILPALAESKAFVDMFVHEAKLAVRLSHANVVQVFDLGRVEQESGPPSYYMAMEYVAGLDLATLLVRCQRRKMPVPFGMAIFVAAEVAKGLDHAHRRRDEQGVPLGIVHRDVSPQNILLSWEGEVKVTDFGIAKARDNLDERPDESSARQLKGKHAYMSPEQARAGAVDARSDIFSLGVVLYEMLAGVNPFRAPTAFETLRRVQACEFPPLELLREDVPKPLAALVQKALGKLPEDRFPEAARMYEELLAYLYQSGARFGAADLSEVLHLVREPDRDASMPDGDADSRPPERTPVEVPTSSTGMRAAGDRSSTPARAANQLAQRREATAMVVSLGRPASEEATAAACELVWRYGGKVVGATPVQLATLFGLEAGDARDNEHAVRSGLRVVKCFERAGVSAAAGVCSGRVLVNPDGTPVQDELMASLLGQAGDLARGDDGRVLVSGATARGLRGLFGFQPGRGDALTVDGERAVHETYGRFVGRREELARIGRLLASASKRQLRLVTLTGPEGIGRTRLMHEVGRRLTKGDFNVGFYLASCPPGGDVTPLSAITAMLHALCGLPSDSAPEKIRAVAPSLRALGLLDEEVAGVLSQLGLHDGPPPQPHALRNGFAKALLRLSEDRVHAFAWDDAHAIDEASLEILKQTARRLATARVTLLFAVRAGTEPSLDALGPSERVEIGELPPEDALRLLSLRFGAAVLPSELSAFCLRRAGGHPLFLEELARDLLDSKAVVVEEGVVKHAALDGERAVPRPLRAIIAGRVARLAREQLATLQAAAILGEPLHDETLRAMIDDPSTIPALEARDLLLRQGPDVLGFASPLLRDVVLDAIPADLQRELHAKAATALEHTLKADDVDVRVASHRVEAGQRDLAASLYGRSAARRLEARQYDAAASDALRSVELAVQSSAPFEVLAKGLGTLADTLERTRAARRAAPVLDAALGYVTEIATPDEQIAARMDIARSYGAVSLLDRALEVLATAHELASEGPLTARAWLVEAQLHGLRGDFARTLGAVAKAEAGALDPRERGRAAKLRAQSHGALGERDAALGHIDRAIAILGDGFPEVEREKMRALTHFFAGDFAASAVASERAAELAKTAGLTFEIAVNLHNLGDTLVRLDEYPRAYAVISESLSACDQCGADRLASQNRMYLGYLDAVKGVPGSETQLRMGIAHAEEHGFVWDVVNGRLLLGFLLERLSMFSAAVAELEACAKLADELHIGLVARDARAAAERCRAAVRKTVAPGPLPTG